MAISKELLEILVCPICKAVVDLKPDQSGLKCVECHRVYPIRDDIPVMLVDEAKLDESAARGVCLSFARAQESGRRRAASLHG